MGGLALEMAGERSLLGEESREDGLDDSEWGDMGLARGDAPWWSEDKEAKSVGTRSPKVKGSSGCGLADLRGSSATAPWPRLI